MKSVVDTSLEEHAHVRPDAYVRPDAARCAVVSVSMPVLMRRTRKRHRIWIAVAAVVFQLALGSVYSWSVFARALREPGSTFAFDATRATLPFSVAVGMVFVGTWCGGRLQERHGEAAVEPAAADASLASVLNVPVGTLLQHLEQVDVDTSGRRVLYSLEWHVPSVIQLRVYRRGPGIGE